MDCVVHIKEIKHTKYQPEDTKRIDHVVDPGAVERILITGISRSWV
jgi:hypothetical protein